MGLGAFSEAVAFFERQIEAAGVDTMGLSQNLTVTDAPPRAFDLEGLSHLQWCFFLSLNPKP